MAVRGIRNNQNKDFWHLLVVMFPSYAAGAQVRPGFVGFGRSFWSREHPEIPALRQEAQMELAVSKC